MAEIKDNIYTLRKRNELTMEDLGKMIGVKRQTIQKYESGETKNIPYDKIIALANALGTTPIELMGWRGPGDVDLNEDVALKDAELVSKYHRLQPHEQDIVMSMIDSLLKKD